MTGWATSSSSTLKIASVVGLTFLYRLLHDVYPVDADRPRLPGYLERLEQSNIAHKEAQEPELAYAFQHVIIREVAYNLLPFQQRRMLHGAIAAWLEQTYGQDLAPFYPLLAYHWQQAIGGPAADPAVVTRAMDYLEKAGEQALNSYANREAARFFTELLALDDRYPAAEAGKPAEPIRRARWKRQLGETYLGLGQLAESQKHLEQAARLIGWPRPGSKVRYALALLRQLLGQRRRLWPGRLVKRDPTAQTLWLEARPDLRTVGRGGLLV